MGRRVLFAVLVAAVGALAGCGSGEKFGEVEGRVTFKGQPVTEGTIVFESKEGHTGETKLDAEGKYVLKPPENRLPPGEYAIMITPLIYIDSSDPKTPPSPVEKRAPNIPQKYRRTGSTPFRETVKEGKNEFNFDMKP